MKRTIPRTARLVALAVALLAAAGHPARVAGQQVLPWSTLEAAQKRAAAEGRASPLVPYRLPTGAPLLLLLLLLGSLAAPRPGRAQVGLAETRHIQAGLGVIPGIGLQGGYVVPRSFYTFESVLYLEGSPPFAGGEGSMQISGGLGGALRLFGILRTLGDPGYVGRDLDVGVRFGPSLFFTLGESSRGENPFGLFLDPFVRLTTTIGGDRLFFAELGVQRPLLRGGLLFRL